MGWKTIIVGTECKASISLNRLKITIDNDYQTFPLCDLNTVIFSHNRVTITIPLLSELVANNINVIICDSKNDPIGVFQPFNSHSLVFKQLDKQINWKITRKKKLWKKIIEHKIDSEISVLEMLKKDDGIVSTLKSYRDSIYNDDQTNREAVSARLYFECLFGRTFSRSNDDVINYALNYGYKILASYISKCITSRGLLTQLGIHHRGESNPFNLTYDFIEPLRAIVDIWVITNIENEFNTFHKQEIIELLEKRVFINNIWLKLTDAIEDLIDSYIAFLNEDKDYIYYINIKKGIRDGD